MDYKNQKENIRGSGKYRNEVYPGLLVDIVLKRDQRSNRLTRGVVKDILSPGDYYRHGIKVRLDKKDVADEDRVGRVQHVIADYPLYHAKEYPIGIIGERILGYHQTLEQIRNVKEYPLNLATKEGVILSWENLYDEEVSTTPLMTILKDRRLRVDEERNMADKPRYALFIVKNEEVIRFLYYEGKEELRLIFDFRRSDLYSPLFGLDNSIT